MKLFVLLLNLPYPLNYLSCFFLYFKTSRCNYSEFILYLIRSNEVKFGDQPLLDDRKLLQGNERSFNYSCILRGTY